MKRSILGLTIIVTLVVQAAAAQATPISRNQGAASNPGRKLAPAVRRAVETAELGELVPVIVTLRRQADLSTIDASTRSERLEETIEELRTVADSTQANLLALLDAWQAEGLVGDVDPYWVFNGLFVDASPEVIQELATRPRVAEITLDATLQAPLPVVTAAAAPEANIAQINAPALWDLGFRGSGIVVANMDTGVDVTHPDLQASWRGGSNSWFDPSGQHPSTPTDVNGHGTSVMGVMVGRDAGGTSIGVAPDAQWIAVKIFNDSGAATISGIHAGFQWLLDPDGNPATPDAPHVVNNSWTFTVPVCNLTFQGDLQALRAAGILPIFAAGNAGPNPGTSISPGNNPEAFAVGAIDDAQVVASFSSRGPSACSDPDPIFPELVAPGVGIRTADLFQSYTDRSGTSFSAPHVAGGLALLLDAFPELILADQEAALEQAAVDLGVTGPDNTYGYGRLDLLAAHQWLANQPPPPPPPPPPPSPALHLSLQGPGPFVVGGLTDVAGEDVLAFDGASFQFLFDGSDVGLAGIDVDGLSLVDQQTILLSLAVPATLPGVGAMDDSDVVRFAATSLGPTTAGTFSLEFDGSDVGLTTEAEDVDALHLLPDGRILMSTTGRAMVPGVGRAEDEDLLAFTPTSLGSTTAGTWALHFDGSDVGLTAATEDVDAASVSAGGDVWLSTEGAFAVTGVAGDDEDVFSCSPTSLGLQTACTYSTTLTFDGSTWGLTNADVDAV